MVGSLRFEEMFQRVRLVMKYAGRGTDVNQAMKHLPLHAAESTDPLLRRRDCEGNEHNETHNTRNEASVSSHSSGWPHVETKLFCRGASHESAGRRTSSFWIDPLLAKLKTMETVRFFGID
jgi:hypothetical protein